MTQAELFKALRGERRTEVDLSLGQVPVSPTIQSGGKYTVVVAPVSRQNSATRLSAVLAQVPQVTGQFKNIQQQAGVREANELTPDEVIRKVEEGDVEAQGLLASFGKEKTFQEQLYSRYFTSTLQPGFTKVESEMRNLTPRQISEIGDVRSYVQQKLVDSIDPDVFNTIKDPNNRFMAQRHNLAMEALIPKVVEGVVGSAERKKQDYTIKQSLASESDGLSDLGVPQGVPEGEDISVTVEGLRSTAFGGPDIDPTTAKEIADGTMARVKGDPKRGSSGMLYRGLEDEIPTVAVHKSSGLKGKDYIKVTSDLFPEGRIFQVAGTGPAPGRLDFFSTNKEDYNKLAAQKLQSVVKVDKDGKPLAVKAPSNIARMVEASSSRLAAQGIGNDQIIAATYKGLSARANSYIANGDLENARELLELIETGDIKVEGKSFIKTATGRTLATEMLKSIEAEEDKIDREENKILGNESKKFENETNAQARAIAVGLSEDPTEEEEEDALNRLAELEQSIVTAQQNNQVDAVTANRLAATISSFETDIKNKTVRLNSDMAVARETYMRASGGIPTDVAKTFSAPTAKSLAVYEDVFGPEFIEQNKVFNTGLGKTQYTDFLTYEMDLIAKDALVATVNQLMPTLDPKDPEFKTKFEEAFESKLRSNLEKDKRRMEEASSAHVDPSALSASEQVRDYLRTNGLEETAQNIQLAQTDLLKKSKANPLFTSQFEVDANYPKLSASSLVQGVNNYHKNQLLQERTNLSSFQLADIHTAASTKVTKQSYALGISDLIKDASNLDRAKILQNKILNDIKNVGLPVDVLEGDMLITHMVSSAAIDPRMMGIPDFSRSFNKTLTLDFNNGDRYFKRYKEAVLSSEAIIAYENGNTSLLNRVFDAGVAKGQLKESQRQDFIDTQLRISQDLGFIKPISQNNEQE